MARPTIQIDQALYAIRALASKASSLISRDAHYYWTTGRDAESDHGAQVAELIDTAFLQLMNLAEGLQLESLRRVICETHTEARRVGLAKVDSFEDQAAWAYWSVPVERLADSIAVVFGKASPSGAVSTDLLTLIQNTQSALTDKRCFEPPRNEAQVHDRVEAILKCVFPDLQRKPPLAKPVVNFIPDSGILSIDTLIEYKFMSDENQAGPISNEILADTRGYAESGWSRIVFVIYETRRFKTVHEWRQLLKACGLSENIQLVLLYGEVAAAKPQPAKSPAAQNRRRKGTAHCTAETPTKVERPRGTKGTGIDSRTRLTPLRVGRRGDVHSRIPLEVRVAWTAGERDLDK